MRKRLLLIFLFSCQSEEGRVRGVLTEAVKNDLENTMFKLNTKMTINSMDYVSLDHGVSGFDSTYAV